VARQVGDGALQQAIDNEKAARMAADNVLLGQLNTVAAGLAAVQGNSVLQLNGKLSLNTADPARPTALFTGVNVQVVNGLNATATTNNVGNLIVGYNEPFGTPARNGSHNIVVGTEHEYTNYGGLVAGRRNTISGYYASVSGGNTNIASGQRASVSGGQSNIASGDYSSVSGGYANTASGYYASVSGGQSNIAFANTSAVLGGANNRAGDQFGLNPNIGPYSTVSGGRYNIATGLYGSVSGGYSNIANGENSSISGGVYHDAPGSNASVSGGYNNTASGNSASVLGGFSQNATGTYQTIPALP